MGNSSSSKSKVRGQVTRVASTEPGYDPRMETRGTLKRHHGTGVYSDNTSLDDDETFNSFIRHAKYKIRTVSHIGREQSNVAPAPAPPPDNEANARDNQNDKFSKYIQSAKKKLRATSSMRKNGSFKRG